MRLKSESNLKRLLASRSGMAATEFALLLPVITMLFFGLVEVSDAMIVNRKVAIAANTLADLTAQSDTIKTTEMDDLFDGVMSILEPNNTSGMQLTLVSVIKDVDGNPVVHWSRNKDGNTPYAANAPYTTLQDPAVLSDTGSLIVVEMVYSYTPSLTHYFVNLPIVFDRESIRWPRVSSRVQLCDASGANCTS